MKIQKRKSCYSKPSFGRKNKQCNMELRYFQIKILNETKRVYTSGEENVLGYMYLDGKPSKGKAPIQKAFG